VRCPDPYVQMRGHWIVAGGCHRIVSRIELDALGNQAEGELRLLEAMGERGRQIYMWGRKEKRWARSSRTCAVRKGKLAAGARRRRWRDAMEKRLASCGGSAGRARLCQRALLEVRVRTGTRVDRRAGISSACGLFFSSDGDEGVEDAFEGASGEPDQTREKGLAMNQTVHRVGGQLRGGRDRHRSESHRCRWAGGGLRAGGRRQGLAWF